VKRFEDAVRPCVRRIEPYVPGLPVEEVERRLGRRAVKLASNENCLGPSPKALEAAAATLGGGVHLYPDGGSYYLRARLAERHRLPADQIVVGAGTTELIQLVALAMLESGREAVYSAGAFILYSLAVLASGAKGVAVPLDPAERHDLAAMDAALTPRTRLVFIANPNNPTGTYVSEGELARFVARLPEGVLLVLDEAYKEYVTAADYPDGVEHVREGRAVIVLRTFSKIYGLAGMRVGYAIGPPEIVDALNRVRSPFNVSSLAQAMALAALDDHDHVKRSLEHNQREVAFLGEGLARRGVPFTPSVGNFLLIDVGRPADGAFEALLQEGVITRPMGAYGFPTRLRVTVGTRGDNERFLAALDRLG
jgi:histidinol-phosphate aminotransferase